MQDLDIQNTEAKLLRCAEEVFLDRGFAGAKTTEIARRAGVNHAMLHYYYRTKEKLFNVVFENKLTLLANSFSTSFDAQLSFTEKLKKMVEGNFDFIYQNPKLFIFLFLEAQSNESRKKLIFDNIYPKIQTIISSLSKSIEEEVTKGIIRNDVKASDIITNIIAVNITTFMVFPFLNLVDVGERQKIVFLQEKKRSNTDFIISSIQLNNAKVKYVQTSLNFE